MQRFSIPAIAALHHQLATAYGYAVRLQYAAEAGSPDAEGLELQLRESLRQADRHMHRLLSDSATARLCDRLKPKPEPRLVTFPRGGDNFRTVDGGPDAA